MIPRRHFLTRAGAFAAGFVGLRRAMLAHASGAGELPVRAMAEEGYGPLVRDPMGIFDLPRGFKYDAFSRTGERMDDGLLVPGAHDAMAAFPGPDGLTILVRNHEIEPGLDVPGPFGFENELYSKVDQAKLYDAGTHSPSRGGTTTILYDTRGGKGHGRVVRHWMSLAGTERNCAGGPTPRNTWITCEECVFKAGKDFAKDHGYCFEVPASAEIGLVDPVPLKAMGRFMHEACCTDPTTGVVYMTEDRPDGLVYRFLPKERDNLVAGGKLQALVVKGKPSCDTSNWIPKNGTPPGHIKVGQHLSVAWMDLSNIESPDDDLRYRGFSSGAARFARGEGMWFGRGTVFMAMTEGGAGHHGQIWKYTPSRVEGTPGELDQPGTLELFVESSGPNVVQNADNITVAPWGDLIVCEDEVTAEHPDQFLLGITPSGSIYRIGRNAMNMSELAGACFSPDGTTLFVNIQRPGITLAIRGPWQKG